MSKLIYVLFIFMLASSSGFGGEVKPMPAEAISDVDFSNLEGRPQMNWGLDPFSRKPGFVKIDPSMDFSTPDKYHLNAIIYDEDDPMAVVNGQTIGVGDDIEDLTVEEIAPNYVVLAGDEVRFELTLNLPKEPKPRAEIKEIEPPKEKDHE